MALSVTEGQWNAVRQSLRTTTERFGELLTSAPDPATTASAGWSVTDIAAHLVTVAWLETTLMGIAADPFPMPGLTEAIAATTVDEVHGFNDRVMSYFTERDVAKLAIMLHDQVDLMLTASQSRDPGETFPWLGGARPTLAGILAHMVNELLIHGNDIARTIRVPWPMPAQDAAFFFELFFVPLASGQTGQLLDGGKRPRKRRIAVEFRSGYTNPITIVVRDGGCTAEPAGQGADATVWFDPVTLNMMLFGRISRSRAILTRKIVLGGRRPWLIPAFLRTVRCPS
jgi:uncharacterized protein (TIGR03083 family)